MWPLKTGFTVSATKFHGCGDSQMDKPKAKAFSTFFKVSCMITEAYIVDTNLFPLGPSCDLVKPGGHVTLGHLWLPLVLKHMISGLLPQRLWPSAHSSISEIIERIHMKMTLIIR